MEEELRKTSADKAKARHCAKGLLKDARVQNAPVIINTLLPTVRKTFNIIVAAAPNGTFSGKADAMTQRRNDTVFIVYDNQKAEVRKRFSVAHELGHIYLGHLHGSSSLDLNSENFDEIEANIFAANLLMPKLLLSSDIKSGLSPEALAKRYGVSIDALWYQLTDAGLINLLHSTSHS
jgi:Zn-dependent peptidase ImmA (M78 family)